MVHQILETMKARAFRSNDNQGTTRLPRIEPPVSDRDPDLQQFERASPEAALELLLLIKKATARKK
ncbi:MAG: hypothetical protein HY269_04970 [Deltaproteobacteria bacterium]|nr:hypothetical protein [Deltaproteobacteria bacterium]